MDPRDLLAHARDAVAHYGGEEDDGANVCARVLARPVEPRCLRAFVFAAVRHAIIDRKRREERYRALKEAWAARRGEPCVAAVDVGPEASAKAIASLRPHWRDTLTARVAGLSCEEIAQRDKIPVGTVLSRIFYAKRALLRALEDGCDE